LDWLVHGRAAASPVAGAISSLTDCEDLLDSVREAVVADYQLNEDQSRVLDACAAWLRGGNADPVLLVHGTFGSGKSFLLVVLVIFLSQVLVRLYTTTLHGGVGVLRVHVFGGCVGLH